MELYCIEVPLAPVQEERFIMCHSGVYANLSDAQFVKLNKVILGNRSQGFRARHDLDFCKRVVDDCREGAKNGSQKKWLGSARVSRFIPATSQLAPVYIGIQEAAPVVDNPGLTRRCFDGTFRTIPNLFQKTPRGWKYAFSILADSHGVPRADFFQAATKTEIVDQIFDPNYQLARDVVLTYPLAQPSEIPEEPKPVAEYVPSQAELDAVEPFDFVAWNRLTSEEHKRKFVFDPLYRAAFEKMLVKQKVKEDERALELEQKQKAETIEKLKKQFITHDANEAFKEGRQ
jgi:hypothetical protein